MSDKAILGAGLDAGSVQTRCVVCCLEGRRLRFLGCGQAPSQGWNRGRLADHNAVSASMREAIQSAEAMAGVSLGSVVLGIGGDTVSGHNSRGTYEFSYQSEITHADVKRAIDRAARMVLPNDRMILHLLAQDFAVDDNPGHRNPVGMMGSKLEAFVHIIMVSMQEHQELVGAANRAHVEVEDSLFEPLAAAYGAVLPRDRREGIIILDIGAQSTEMAVYYGEAVIHSGGMRLCGDHFTWDVARGLRLNYQEAEAAKQQYGCAVMDHTAANSIIVLPGSNGREARERPRRDLNLILEARAKDLFDWVRDEMVRISMDQSVVGVVLTGGAARLAGMCELAEEILGCQARNGLPVGIQDWPQELNTPAWTTAAGLAMYSARRKFLEGRERGGSGLLRGWWG